jgi:hypothetical protein
MQEAVFLFQTAQGQLNHRIEPEPEQICELRVFYYG